ncbi:hypothetical protein F4780DRAFT_776813 [Xylariomycetidae sp. FL0641]|nr:hypothetical protein F4780DRAFT_776813 [Xylariomycetidae sp. FL0641]
MPSSGNTNKGDKKKDDKKKDDKKKDDKKKDDKKKDDKKKDDKKKDDKKNEGKRTSQRKFSAVSAVANPAAHQPEDDNADANTSGNAKGGDLTLSETTLTVGGAVAEGARATLKQLLKLQKEAGGKTVVIEGGKGTGANVGELLED